MNDAHFRRHLGQVRVDDAPVHVELRVDHDGIEHVGRLWFESADAPGVVVSDRAVLPGRSDEAVLARARGLSEAELVDRYRRALSERRRFHPLRRTTSELLGKIRRLNRVATSMRAGLMDADGAARELAAAERDLHDLVRQLREVAGDEE